MRTNRKAWQRTGRDTRIRGTTGQKLRKRRLARTNGLCEHCLAEGVTTLTSVVNHKLPLAHGGLDVDENTENLCARHDAIVTAAQLGKAEPVKRRASVATGDRPAPTTRETGCKSRRQCPRLICPFKGA